MDVPDDLKSPGIHDYTTIPLAVYGRTISGVANGTLRARRDRIRDYEEPNRLLREATWLIQSAGLPARARR